MVLKTGTVKKLKMSPISGFYRLSRQFHDFYRIDFESSFKHMVALINEVKLIIFFNSN